MVANATVPGTGKVSILYGDGGGSGANVISVSDTLAMSNPEITGGVAHDGLEHGRCYCTGESSDRVKCRRGGYCCRIINCVRIVRWQQIPSNESSQQT